jgi:hypothetical protein
VRFLVEKAAVGQVYHREFWFIIGSFGFSSGVLVFHRGFGFSLSVTLHQWPRTIFTLLILLAEGQTDKPGKLQTK